MPKRPDLRRILFGAAAASAALLAWAAWPGPAPEREAAEPVVRAPAPPPAVPAPPPAAPAPSADGLVLHGLAGGGAIVALPDGAQRFVRIGREVVPGLALAEIRQHHAVLRGAGGDLLLGFAGTAAAAEPPAAAPPSSGTASRLDMGAGESRHRQATVQYRLGLAPRRDGGRITGFAIRSGAELPGLGEAGLRPGDVLLAVNGQSFDDEEQVLELSRNIAGSYTATFEFERGGRRMSASLEVNPRT